MTGQAELLAVWDGTTFIVWSTHRNVPQIHSLMSRTALSHIAGEAILIKPCTWLRGA